MQICLVSHAGGWLTRQTPRGVGGGSYDEAVPVRLRPLEASEVEAVLARLDAAAAVAESPDKEDVRAAVKHFLAVLTTRAPGKSVEVRVPPYAAVQVIPGVRHTRGTPPAVVETDASTWIALATGELTWADADARGQVSASGERCADLPLLVLE